MRYSDTLILAAEIIEERGVNLGGWPYMGRVTVEDAVREAHAQAAFSACYWPIESGMTTVDVVEMFRDNARGLAA